MRSITRYLLVSDLDGTLIPPGRDQPTLDDVAAFSRALKRADDVLLAYVTGRHFSLAKHGIEELGLPVPDLLVCDVGTSLYQRADGGYEPSTDYREAVREAFGGLSADELRGAVGPIEGLELQESEKQGEFKLSYYVDGRPESIVERVEEQLRLAGASVSLVASYDAVERRGLLDILPAGVAKDYAVKYLHDHTGVEEDRLVYAGDSGNDLAAMLSGYQVVVVANAEESLKEELRLRATSRGIVNRIYFAQHRYARGVLEGCRHFGLIQSP